MPNRSYRQYCALARALDVIGDRWSILIVRNLILGPQRWSELRSHLPGIAKNLLSARLADLQATGVITHEGDLYALTPTGEALKPAIFALGNWGEAHFMGPPEAEDAFRLRYLMTSVHRKLKPTEHQATLSLHIDDHPFTVHLGPTPSVTQNAHPTPDATLRCAFTGLRALLFSSTSLTSLITEDLVTLEGDEQVVHLFIQSIRRTRPQPT